MNARLLGVVGFVAALLMSGAAHGATYTADLGVRATDITFVPQTLVVGQTARVYATVHNFGAKDMRASVLFFQGASPIGEEQPISARAGGFADEVFADFTVPNGPFNILVRVRAQVPADENNANDEALSQLISPMADEDRDGMSDAADNCVKVANADQADTDHDGQGNACDADDDNDGLSDQEEVSKGTNPLNPDTDGDGVSDSKDVYPTDAKRTKQETVVAKTAPAAEKKELPKIIPVAQAKESAPKTAPMTEPVEPVAVAVADDVAEKKPSGTVVRAAMEIDRENWNTFAYAATGFGAPKGAQYFWQFGDGGEAEGKEVTHTFKSPGDYTTVLAVKHDGKEVSRDSAPVSVSFWNFSNPKIWVLVGLLSVVMLWMLGVLLRK